MHRIYLFFLFFVFLFCGCQSTFGPRALKYTHPAYNQVIVNTLDQQMLLNLVRLKYRDSAFFLNINSVTASFGMGADIGVDAELPLDRDQFGVRLGDGRLIKPNVGMSYSQSPTISYTPLQGEEFLERVLTPIPIEALLILTQSGWRIDRVFAICIERINDLHNAPRASGPTPSEEPQHKKFQKMLALLYQLQVANLIEIGPHLDLDKSRRVMVLIKPDPDYQSIIEAIKNLVENAIKFNSKPDKQIKISGAVESKFIRFTIEDNGPGIPPEEHSKIFQRFYQIEESFTGQVEGAGLGLALAKRVVESHGGEIGLTSTIGSGSKFFFTLPVASS